MDECWCNKLNWGERCMCSVVQGGVVEVGINCWAVVSKVEKVGGCMGHVVVGESLGGGKSRGRMVDNVLVGGVGRENLKSKRGTFEGRNLRSRMN